MPPFQPLRIPVEADPSKSDFLTELIAAPLTALAGAAMGGIMALLCVAIGLLRVLVVVLAGRQVNFDDYTDLLYYMLGFISGGAAAGLLWPLRRWIGSYYGLGIVVMAFVMLAILLVEEGPISSWDRGTWIGFVLLTVFFGLALGHGAASASREKV